jgi:formylglycine-generating enzyme required for sulfatase activity
MTNAAAPSPWQTEATRVNQFVARFGHEGYRQLVYHAALPLVLTPELVHYLRVQFLQEAQVPWEAEVDLLLSDLCSQVGYELYTLDTQVRAYLLAQMKADPYWQQRQQEVAQVLISYVSYLSRVNPKLRQRELEAQRLAAMTYLGDEHCQAAARTIAERLKQLESGSDQGEAPHGVRSELAYLTRLTQELAPQLEATPELVEWAALVQRLLRQPEAVRPEEMERSYRVGEYTFSPSTLPIDLPWPIPSDTSTATISSPVPDATTVARGVVWPELKTLEFHTGRWVEESATDEAASDWPPLHTETVEVVTLEFQDTAAPETAPPETAATIPEVELVPFTFDVATLHRQGGGWQVRRQQQQAQRYIERLGNSVFLTLVAIPGGSFVMGSPSGEQGRQSREGPQHDVQVPAFLMGRYPVTQEQWRAVAAMPMQSRELNLDPSRFKGDNRPVERVSWYDAVEFCSRLSVHTGRQYRLPSEAEWEYACRAGTTTPFHFGGTLSPEVANYSSSSAYANGPTGNSPGETTPVDRYGVANGFGLCDMHGNVWEWCLDHYHSSYEGAPSDGSAWINAETEKDKSRILRGGSWILTPRDCRSAFRIHDTPRASYYYVGFRVMCVAPRALQ